MNLPQLIAAYFTDTDSPVHKLRPCTKQYYHALCRRLEADFGDAPLTELKARRLLHWNDSFGDKVTMAHATVGMLRTIVRFGMIYLEDVDCERLSVCLHGMRFKMGSPRTERLTAAQAEAIRKAAHALNHPSVALAQAFQFECMLRQKDVIGEWVPLSESGLSDVLSSGRKWLRGLRWEEIDGDFILTHLTSKRQKVITVDLKLAPMVMEEIGKYRAGLPLAGPIITADATGLPWTAPEFRRTWRMIARAAGIPDAVYNMDSRAGAISEATDAGADLEHVRQAATHSDIAMTQRYSRGAAEKIEGVMRRRVEFRKNGG